MFRELYERVVAFIKENRVWFIAGLAGLLLLIGVAVAAPARADEAPACVSVEAVVKKLADENGGIQPVKRLGGKAADELARKFGADFEASHMMIYVVGDTVYLAAFVGGCFKGIAGIPLMFFLANAPDVL